LTTEVASWSLSVSTDFQDTSHKDRGAEMHNNVLEFPLLNEGIIDPIQLSVMADFRKLIHCCIEFPTL
jgi:hypothetical protein